MIFQVPKLHSVLRTRRKRAIPLGKKLKKKHFSTSIYSRPHNSLQQEVQSGKHFLPLGEDLQGLEKSYLWVSLAKPKSSRGLISLILIHFSKFHRYQSHGQAFVARFKSKIPWKLLLKCANFCEKSII